jgi:hypothetical protein
MALRLFILQPTIVFQAQINLAGAEYPISALPYDNVTIGAYSAVKAGMTLVVGTTAGAEDKGRQRVRKVATADTIYIGRSSQGIRDGELQAEDNYWITVYDDYRVWARLPYIDPAQIFMPEADTPLWTTYKDGDIEVGTNTSSPPPVANCGPGYCGTINGTSGEAIVAFDGSDSFAVADGETIATYSWDIKDGTLLFGTINDPTIYVTFPAGFRWVSLTVIDTAGKGHIAYAPTFTRDPEDDDSFEAFQITERVLRYSGQRISFKLLSDLSRDTFLDGTLFMLWDEALDGSGRYQMEFIGWHQTDPTEISAQREGVLRDTTLTCLDVAGKLDTLPGLPQILNTDAVREELYDLDEMTWEFMPNPNWNKWLHYLLHWHSTALSLADWKWAPEGDTYPFIVREAQGATLYSMVDAQCQNLVPDHYLTCNSMGQMRVLPDPTIVPEDDRTTYNQVDIDESIWKDIRFTYKRFKELYWLWSSAVGTQSEPVYLPSTGLGGKPKLDFTTYFCVAPGEAPGQGAQQRTVGNKLARSQAELNECEGNRYGKINARHDHLRVTFATGYDYSIEPADMAWVTLKIPAQYAPQRGMRFTEARGLVHELSYRYSYSAGGVAVEVEMEWEREVFPSEAVTVIPPVTTPASTNPYWPVVPIPAPTPVVVPEETPFTGGINVGQEQVAMIDMGGEKYLYRTSNFQNASPTWDQVNLNIPDYTIYGWVVDPFSPGYLTGTGEINGWVVTQTKIYRLEDIFGATPSQTAVHTFSYTATYGHPNYHWRTINASFGAFFVSDNPWLVCVSHYGSLSGHEGTWATYSTDGGTTWSSEVQLSAHYNSSIGSSGRRREIGLYVSPKTPGLAYTTAYTSTSSTPSSDGFVSTDYGATWTAISNPDIQPGNALGGNIHVPWHTNDGEDLAYHGHITTGSARQYRLKKVDGTTISDISPSDGVRSYGCNRAVFGIRAYDSDRTYLAVGAIGNDVNMTHNDDKHAVFVSGDAGATWTNITGVIADNVVIGGNNQFSVAFSGTDPNTLFVWGPAAGYISYTEDFGVTLSSKTGNLMSSFPSWINGCIGIAGGPTP